MYIYLSLSLYIYMYKHMKIEPLIFCSPQAATNRRFNLQFHACRRTDDCQSPKNLVSFAKHVQKRAHTEIPRQIDLK